MAVTARVPAIAIALAIGCLSLPTLFYRLGDAEVSGVLEGRVAVTAREMDQAGEWILPTLNGAPRLQKPPLSYWLAMSSAHALGGHSEWSLRLPMALCGVGVVLCAWAIGRRTLGPATGWLPAFVLVTLPLLVHEMRLASSDAPLALAAAGAWICQLEARHVAGTTRARRVWQWLFYTCLGIGALAKGPVILALAMAPLLVEAVMLGRLEPLRVLWNPGAIAWFLAISLAWPVLVVGRVGVPVAKQWFLESFGKVLPTDGVDEGYRYQGAPGPLAYYVLRLPAYFLFWTWALLLGLIVGWRSWRAARRDIADAPSALRASIFIQFLTVLSFFSLVAEKKGPYLLPAMLPGALLIVLGVLETSPLLPVICARGAMGIAIGLAGGGVALLCAPELLAVERWAATPGGMLSSPRLVGLLAVVLGLGCWLGARRLLAPGRAAAGFGWLAACLALGMATYYDVRLARPADEPSMRVAAAAAEPHLGPERRVAVAGQIPLDFIYYLRARVRPVHHEVGGKIALEARQLPSVAMNEPLIVSESVLLASIRAVETAPRALDAVTPLTGDLCDFRIRLAFHQDSRRVRDRFYLLLREAR